MKQRNHAVLCAPQPAFVRGLNEAFTKVDAIGKAEGSTTTVPTVSGGVIPAIAPSVPRAATYILATIAKYDAATQDQKLSLIMYEKYVAGFGFGEDIWTDWRRTSYPTIRQPGEVPGTISNGSRPVRLFYDIQELTSNRNAPREQPDASSRIFWDVN